MKVVVIGACGTAIVVADQFVLPINAINTTGCQQLRCLSRVNAVVVYRSTI